ncbi:hypothetical protein DLH72_00595 [Candidatus Gracilibacteria bacterium]|nr:MAG: hypothetical protein DLH72_00595 [Candidatus Gracilibacteria bacterium]
MENKKTVEAIIDFIITAEKSIKNAKKLLKDLADNNEINLKSEIDLSTKGLETYTSNESRIIEGVFTGSEMLGSDGNKYPVPANYASKSKMVQGDRLKLTIDNFGKMMYKQIAPIEREIKTGLIVKDKDKYQVVSDGKTYDLLTAAVTHFKANIGDKVSIIIPAGKQATFAAIEAVIN